MRKVLIVGAGFSGAVIARKLAQAGVNSLVIEKRSHVAGNCHTARDPETGVMVHSYGPHVFHTDDVEVWNLMCEFGEMKPYVSQIKITAQDQVYQMPINLHTINQFFRTRMRPSEARSFLASLAEPYENPQNLEELALATLGRELYETFFKGYTTKQWGVSPSSLPVSIFKRLPVRFNYDDNYFFHRFQGIPKGGYSSVVENLLDHDRISVVLESDFQEYEIRDFDHTFYSGAIDAYFNYSEGRLGYRTLDFKEFRTKGDYQGVAIMNFGDQDVPYTRVTEHKHFAPWEEHQETIYYEEYSRLAGPSDIPYYPIRLAQEKEQLFKYESLAANEKGVSFIGRLGTYRYLDMDVTIREAINVAHQALNLSDICF